MSPREPEVFIQPRYFIVDHERGDHMLRSSLINHMIYLDVTPDDVAEKSGVALKDIVRFCAGSLKLPYSKLERIVRGVFDAELRVTIPARVMVNSGCPFPGDGDGHALTMPTAHDDEIAKWRGRFQEYVEVYDAQD